MPYVLTQFSVKNFSQWKVVFDEFVPIRRHYSSKGARAFCVSNNPESVVVLTEFEDLERAIEMYASKDFKDAIQRAGVIGSPVVTLLKEVDRLSA
ncbi:MAG: cyclase [Bellilinea sp.]